MISPILILVFLIFLYLRYVKNSKTSNKCILPDGPNGLPIIGNLLQIIDHPYLKFSKWAYKYGRFYTVNILGTPALVVNDVQAMKQVFGSMESTGRFKFELLDKITGGLNGIANAEGKEWHEVRMFTMKALRECGMFRSSVIEPAVEKSFEEVISWFESESKNCLTSGVVYPLRETFIHAISNSLWNILSKNETDCGNKEIGRLVVKFVDMVQVTTKSGLLFFPWLKYIAPEWSGYNKSVQVCEEFHAQVQKFVDERKQRRKNAPVEHQNRNLLDAYLDHWENCTDLNSSFYGEVGWKHCFYSVVAILLAGGETTATTLNWMINYLVAYPEVQQKLHEEIQKLFGKDGKPSLADKKKLPYLEAVIFETLRMSSLVPFGVIHKLLDSVEFEGYHLPKDTILIANLYHVHNDPAIWGDPENFRPERFLDVDDEQRSSLRESVVAFQAGKRICPGEGLARDELFLAAAKLVQKFQFLPAPGKMSRDYVKPVVGYFLIPNQIGVQVKTRF